MRMTCQYVTGRPGCKTLSYRRGVPTDLRQFYSCPFIVIPLKTKDMKVAAIKAEAVNAEIEQLWEDLRNPETTILAQGRLSLKPTLPAIQLRQAGYEAGKLWQLYNYAGRGEPVEVEKPAPEPKTDQTMSKALELYLHLHENGQKPRFIYLASMPVKRAIEIIGDKPLPDWLARTFGGFKRHSPPL
jgi:hypothetical protein